MSGASPRTNRRPAPPPAAGATGQTLRKPRLLIAGEFSSGKTQLISGLLGETVLPSNVTSTALPPVWLIGGNDAGVGQRVAVQPDGETRPVEQITEFDLEDTRYGVVSHSAPILDLVDIIDTPGNSDPNIPPEMWQQMVEYADAVIWCSNATQAWRQSEKAVWMEMPEHLLAASTMLITHADRMTDQRSADRVLRRVRREAGRFFEHFLVASLISDQDIARLTQHVRDVAEGLTARNGADNPVVAGLASEMTQNRTPAQTITPRRLRSTGPGARGERSARPGREELPDQSPLATTTTQTPELPEPGPETLRLEPEMGRARQLWTSLGGGTPDEDSATLLARVDRLIALLDMPSEAQGAPADTDSFKFETENPDDDVQAIQAIVRAYE